MMALLNRLKNTKESHIHIFVILSVRKFPASLLLWFGRIVKCTKCFFLSMPRILLSSRKKKKKRTNKKSLSCYFLLWVIAFSIPSPSEAFTVSSAFQCFYWFVALQGESQTLAKPKGVLTSFFKNKSTGVLDQCKESERWPVKLDL